jgi:hypothetical protein
MANISDKFEEITPEFYSEDRTDDEADFGSLEPEVDELTQEFVNKLIDKMMTFQNALVGHDLHPYQKPLA